MPEGVLRPAAFIDRDGVINEERGYVHRIADFHLLPGVVEGLRVLQQAGYALVVITNQAGIARGLYGEPEYAALTHHMRHVLASSGVTILDVYHCPHHPEALLEAYRVACECRKPRPGMLLRAAAKHGLDLGQSVLIGDKGSDIEAGQAAHLAACVLVSSGHALSERDRTCADAVQPGLLAAARWVVANVPARPPAHSPHRAG
jgi:D-glycero-D-manno-heptose 1,7-bisphosphate phosphatase